MTDNKQTEYITAGSMSIAKLTNGTPTYLYTDHLGSTIMEADASGNVIASSKEQYAPFGEKLNNAASNQDDVSYTGHIEDSAIGLTYMQARYYDPVVGRFYSNDPVGFLDSRPVHSFGRYTYVNNNPYLYNDPDGELGHIAIGAIAGGIIGAAAYALTTDNFNVKDLAVNASSGAIVGAVTAAVPGAIAAGTLNFGGRAANIAASGGNAVAAGSAGSAATQKITTGSVDSVKALVAGVSNAVGLGAGNALVKPAAAIATTKSIRNAGLATPSLNGNTFMVSKTATTSYTSEGLKQGLQDIAGEASSAILNETSSCSKSDKGSC